MSEAANEVKRALGSGDHGAALSVALDQWRAHRCSILGDVVESIDAMIERVGPQGESEASFQKRWLAASKVASGPLEVGWLAAFLFTRVPLTSHMSSFRMGWSRYGALEKRIKRLAASEPDPRIATAALAEAGKGLSTSQAVYQGLFTLVAKHGDHRHLAAMRALIDNPTGRSHIIRDFMVRQLHAYVATLEGRLGDDVGDGAWQSLLPQRPLRPDEVRAEAAKLIDEILEDPFNDELRDVCADRLQELGDPRGEFIALQRIARPDKEAKRRMRELQAKHHVEWLGPELSLLLRSVNYRDGFPIHATLVANHEAGDAVWQRALEDKRLATIEVLHRGKALQWRHRLFREQIAKLQSDEEE